MPAVTILRRFGHSAQLARGTWKGDVVCAASHVIHVYDGTTGAHLRELEGPGAREVVVAAAGDVLVLGDGKSIIVYDEDGPIASFDHEAWDEHGYGTLAVDGNTIWLAAQEAEGDGMEVITFRGVPFEEVGRVCVPASDWINVVPFGGDALIDAGFAPDHERSFLLTSGRLEPRPLEACFGAFGDTLLLDAGERGTSEGEPRGRLVVRTKGVERTLDAPHPHCAAGLPDGRWMLGYGGGMLLVADEAGTEVVARDEHAPALTSAAGGVFALQGRKGSLRELALWR